METCYRHPSRETGVSCSSCGRPICPDCMTSTSVGMRCPECSRERTKVRGIQTSSEPYATYALMAINVLVYLASASSGGGLTQRGGGALNERGGLFGPLVADGEWYRLVTSGFLHAGFIHLAFNMLFLFFLGQLLEPALGRARFVALYLVSLLGGSLGALLFTPDALTVGASGACFGMLGGALVVARDRGISIMDSGLGGTLAINLLFTFAIPGISIGGHLGGLVGGVLAGMALVELGERRRQDVFAYAACVVLAAALVVAALAAAERSVA